MVIRHTEEQVNWYFNSGGINQSSLVAILDNGIEAFLEKQDEYLSKEESYEEKKHFIIGSGVDFKLSHGADLFYDRYHISELARKPGEKAGMIVRMAMDLVKKTYPGADIVADLRFYSEQVWMAANEIEYYMKRAKKNHEEDLRINSIIKENGQEYWQDLINAGHKQVVADDESTAIEGISKSFLEHAHTAQYFEDDDDTILVYQMPLFFNYDGVCCKALPDFMRIEVKNKIIRVIDFKTLWDFVTQFGAAIRRRRYDIQGSFYHYGVTQNFEAISRLTGVDLKGFTVKNVAFMANSTKNFTTPLMFVMDNSLMNRGRNGDGFKVKGWVQGIKTYQAWARRDFLIERAFPGGVVLLDQNCEFLLT